MSESKTIAELSIDTTMLVDRLRTAQMGEVIPYSALSEIIGRSVQNVGRGNMQSARRIVQRDDNIVFEPVVGLGLKRLDDDGIAATGSKTLSTIRNAARRGVKRLSLVIYERLTVEAKVRFNASTSVLAMLHHVTKHSSVKKLENKARESQDKLPLGKTLDAFRNSE